MKIYFDTFKHDFLDLTIFQNEESEIIGITYNDFDSSKKLNRDIKEINKVGEVDIIKYFSLRRDNPLNQLFKEKNLQWIPSDLKGVKNDFFNYMKGGFKRFHSPISLRGTVFQLKVWNYLLGLDYGKVVSYGEVASNIGHPNSQRAVGNAVGANPIAIIIPCHRVLNHNKNSVGHYNGGESIKKKLLELEKMMF